MTNTPSAVSSQEPFTEPTTSSPFKKCLILVTTSGRSLLHHRKDREYHDLGGDSKTNNGTATTMAESYSPGGIGRAIVIRRPADAHDPLLLFANIIGITSLTEGPLKQGLVEASAVEV